MKKFLILVIALCAVFVVLSVAANYLMSGSSGQGIVGGISTFSSNTLDTTTNPLLSFLDDAGTLDDSRSGSSGSGGSSHTGVGRSPYAGKVSLSNGTASYAVQTFEEYITLRNSGSEPVNITGWTLTNSKGTRPVQNIQNDYFYPTADSATIGQGTEFLNPSGVFSVGPIILAAGDEAILTTGRPFTSFPFSIHTSFRENICVGYLRNYPFNPQLSLQCPYPTNDPAIRNMTDECYDYMQSLNRCQDPEKYDKARFDMQTSICRAFMTERLNYPKCVANNVNKPEFSRNQWRVFLGKDRELWANRRETITLYDTKNLIVDQISY